MSTRALRLTALLLAAVAAVATAPAAAAAARVGRPLFGGWSPIKDVSHPHIQELGGWAVAEHARRVNDGLRFGEVTGGEKQVVSGMNYKLVLDATDADGAVAAYVAFVYEQSWTNTRELMSFELAN
ncbi:cystatin 6 precursor [Panicum miliaceum]|uniref:Cystatin 6 n=1 Tax=Panicum miliaceum TaxID=4540 RepID=A0A3L6TL17_PANMI|nr:cystatin 6 precursor [Panicum miliaceum]